MCKYFTLIGMICRDTGAMFNLNIIIAGMSDSILSCYDVQPDWEKNKKNISRFFVTGWRYCIENSKVFFYLGMYDFGIF